MQFQNSEFESPFTRAARYTAILFCSGLLALWSPAAESSAAESIATDSSHVDFQKQIQPILAQHCTHCHGADPESRHGGLRLDLQSGVFAGGESGQPAIVPGDLEKSPMVARIHSTDPDSVMPPPLEQKPLNDAQKKLLEQWILEGAKYTDHWAFVAPQKRPVPESPSGTDKAYSNLIDAFIQAQHAEAKIVAKSMADPATLCRRLYLDLIGLPPSPQEVIDFKTQGFDATVDKLLASERFAEKWARQWLDLARYSDTNGYEKDLPRQQWAWRDWVINAIHKDMPYDQFVIEQIAGDLLPNATQDQVVATGFLRNSMLNEEGAIIPEQFRMFEMFDRIDCIGKSVLGLSTQCAQCHTHKFDPITHDEYFGMFAYLNDTYEAQSWVYTEQQLAKLNDIRSRLKVFEDRVRSERADWQSAVDGLVSKTLAEQADWKSLHFKQLEAVSGLNHPRHEEDDTILMLGHVSTDVFMVADIEIASATGARLEILGHDDLPFGGPGRGRAGGWGLSEWEVLTKSPTDADWVRQKLVNVTADFSNVDEKYEDGKKTKGSVSFVADQSMETMWTADRGVAHRNQSSVVVAQFEQPVNLPAGSQIKMVLQMHGEMIGCCRFSLTQTPAPAASPIDYEAVQSMKVAKDIRTVEQEDRIFQAWRKSEPSLSATNQEIAAIWNEFPEGYTSVMHLADRRPSQKRSTHLLDRGSWDKPTHEVKAHTPVGLHPIHRTEVLVSVDSVVNAEPPRLQFARWLVDRQSPLTARVAVNRVWYALFGIGLVETTEDFGTRVAVPRQQQLLDWLAVDFMENGWRMKQLIRQMVSSQAYQRDSHASPEQYADDPQNNRLLRGPRFRVDAEVIRDIAMSLSGLITHNVGGPPIIPPVPQNVLDFNYVYPAYWKATEGPERYRRTLYNFRKRSMPDPAMSTLDAPNGDLSCSRRVRSNTPLAALTGLNEPIFVESARALALRILRESPTDDASRIQYAYQVCMSRPAKADEVNVVQDILDKQRTRIAEGWLNPREVATGDAARLPDLPPNTNPQDAAAWTLVARVLLNLDETISKN